MEKQRYLPFGYRIHNGEIQIDPEEGKFVPEIFSACLSGNTLQKIADFLQSAGISYSELSPAWSKHIVRRILENRKYCGEKGFPMLVEPEIFEKASGLRHRKAKSPLPHISSFRNYMTCEQCNSTLRPDSSTRGKIFWKCAVCHLRTGPISNDLLIQSIINILNHFIQNPDSFHSKPAASAPIPLKTEKLDREIERMTEQPHINMDHAISMILKRAQFQYETLEPVRYDPDTLRLCRIYRNRHPIAEIDSALLQESVQSILLSPAGEIQIRFINGQIYPEQEVKMPCRPK